MHTCENNTFSPPPFITMKAPETYSSVSHCLIKIEDGEKGEGFREPGGKEVV